MASLNKNEYGQVLYANLGEDISTATAYKFVLEPKLGTKLEKVDADGVTLGTANVDVGDETYLANQYVKYTTQDGDISYSGEWRSKGEATMSSTNQVIGDYTRFTVLP